MATPALATRISIGLPSASRSLANAFTGAKSAWSNDLTSASTNPVSFLLAAERHQSTKRLRTNLEKSVPSAAFLPLSILLQAKISLADFIRAKCLAASNPSPELAPVMSTVFPERSVVRSGGAAFLWCIKYFQMDGLAMITMIPEGYAFGLECLKV